MRCVLLAAACSLGCGDLGSDVLILRERESSGGAGVGPFPTEAGTGNVAPIGGASGADNEATAGAAGTGGVEADCAEVARRTQLAYLHCRTPLAWDAALAECEARGGTLIELADAALEDEIYPQLDVNAWIGLFIAAGATQFTWTDGTPLGAEANWRPTEPTGDGRCVQVIAGIATSGAGHWNDLGCPAEESYLCQIPIP